AGRPLRQIRRVGRVVIDLLHGPVDRCAQVPGFQSHSTSLSATADTLPRGPPQMESVATAEAAELLAQARRIVVFTGAGMSAERGVPAFRADLTGLWARYDAERRAAPEAFHADPDLVWGWYEWRRARVRRAKPNPGHLAVAALEARLPGSIVVTQ